jgi:phosphate transport system substrate-binding protein
MKGRIPTLAILSLLALTLTTPAQALTLSWAGCGITKKAFMAELAEAYQRKTGVEITIEGGGATKGIRQIAEKGAHIGGSCRYRIKEDNAPESQVKFNPVAWDALVVIVNRDNPLDSITLEQLRDIYLGRIHNWKQIGGEDKPLELLIRRGKISGVGLTIRQLVFGDPELEFSSSHIYKSSGPLEEALENNPNGIAMTGISSARKRDLKILKLNGKEPNFENIKSGSYLLYRPLYIVTNRTDTQAAEVNRFLGFAHSPEGREIIRKNGVVPYLEALWLTRKQRKQWVESRRLEQGRSGS